LLDKIGEMAIFSKYEGINDNTITDFISSVPKSFSDAIHVLSQFNKTVENPDVLFSRAKLQKSVLKFHNDADTITAKVKDSIKLLNLSDTQIFFTTHQPNLFAYSGVFKKIVLIQTLKNELEIQQKSRRNIANLFIIIDHDFMDEIWMRRAQLPSIKHTNGILEIKFPINKENRWRMVCNMPLPRREIVDHWKGQIYSWIKNLSTPPSLQFNKHDILDNFDEFWTEIEKSYSRAKTYSDFNSFLISQIVNRIWNYDVLFTRLTDMSSIFENGYRHLIQNYDVYSDALRKSEISLSKHNTYFPGISSNSSNKAPLWIHCKCGSKSSSKLYKNTHGQVQLAGVCISCKNNLCLQLGKKNELEGLKDNLDNISPKAIPILLLLSKCLDSICYVSGSGGLGYMAYGCYTYDALNIKRPVNIFWPARDVYTGSGQLEALHRIGVENQSEVEVYLKSLREKEIELHKNIKPILKERELKIRSGQQIEKLLSDLFILKQEQRENRKKIKVTENVKNTINLMPCIIDYAINFGIKNTELQWHKNLLKNNSLYLPIKLANDEVTP